MRILLVDDEPSLLSLLSQYLTRQGHEVQTAETCAAASGIVEASGGIDAAIIDLTLPDGSGEDIAKACALRHANARIVIATGYDYTAPSDTWTVLQKPFLPRALLHILG
jgi:DNA-binding NtrC family response regulator